ncbi:MAG: FxDxF family PEP-CTERM protein [Pseudomonadota bacterium]
MKNSKSLIAALVLATASFGSGALAADISTPPQALNLVGTSAFFGDSFDIDQADDTFSDQFTFSVTGDLPAQLDAIVSSISRSAAVGLDITGLALYSGAGAQLATGTSMSTGAIDVWTVQANNLEVGSYYLQVSGTMVSDTSGSFGGAVMLQPVPEPAAYGMMLAGLGLVGFMARRRSPK